jgi:hypothetical protein
VASPDIGYATLTLLVGFSFIANGIAMIAAGLLLRTLTSRQPPRPDVAIAS